MHKHRAFTLIELLVIIAIISILAAIVMPVFSQARGKSFQASCQANEMQLGEAIQQYAQDYDERMPNGLNSDHGVKIWGGEGWAGQCSIYVKSSNLFHCPTDTTPVEGIETAASYGYNYDMIRFNGLPGTEPPRGAALFEMNSPSRSVLLFEVSGVTTVLPDSREGTDSGRPGAYFSASGNGLDNRLYARKDWTTGISNQYATGYMGGRKPFNLLSTQFSHTTGRHQNGSNFLMSDGHVKWLTGPSVSTGLNAVSEDCEQDNSASQAGCGGTFNAAGTASKGPFQVTFSIR